MMGSGKAAQTPDKKGVGGEERLPARPLRRAPRRRQDRTFWYTAWRGGRPGSRRWCTGCPWGTQGSARRCRGGCRGAPGPASTGSCPALCNARSSVVSDASFPAAAAPPLGSSPRPRLPGEGASPPPPPPRSPRTQREVLRSRRYPGPAPRSHRPATAVSAAADPAASQPSLTSARRGGPRPSAFSGAGRAGAGVVLARRWSGRALGRAVRGPAFRPLRAAEPRCQPLLVGEKSTELCGRIQVVFSSRGKEESSLEEN